MCGSAANRAYSTYLSLLLGFPQSLWRDRHLAHHRGEKDVPLARQTLFEAALIALLWLGLALAAPAFFFMVYLPGYAFGLALCRLHGHFEHAPETQSHYGMLYNAWFFRRVFFTRTFDPAAATYAPSNLEIQPFDCRPENPDHTLIED